MTTMHKQTTTAFGLLIVGNEILDGRRHDFHFADTNRQLQSRNLALAYTLILPDMADILISQLAWAFARPEPFFCCGGIGGTPDDLTRDCAAQAAGVRIVSHPEGEAILRRRFGADATASRLRMVAFPEGADLIPNPVNQVPGFRFRNGYFLPGFPQMASPMRAWILAQDFAAGSARKACALRLPNAREAELSDLMEAFINGHPALSFSSLPFMGETENYIELGLAGEPTAVDRGFCDLKAMLKQAGVLFR